MGWLKKLIFTGGLALAASASGAPRTVMVWPGTNLVAAPSNFFAANLTAGTNIVLTGGTNEALTIHGADRVVVAAGTNSTVVTNAADGVMTFTVSSTAAGSADTNGLASTNFVATATNALAAAASNTFLPLVSPAWSGIATGAMVQLGDYSLMAYDQSDDSLVLSNIFQGTGLRINSTLTSSVPIIAPNYIGPGTGLTNLQQGILNVVTEGGADRTGATDSTAAIQAAMNAAAGRVVYFPAGLYKCNLTLTNAGIRLLGEASIGVGTGQGSTTELRANNGAMPIIRVGNDAIHLRSWSMRYFYLNGQTTSGIGLHLDGGAMRGDIQDIYTFGFQTNNVLIKGGAALGVMLNRFRNCRFYTGNVTNAAQRTVLVQQASAADYGLGAVTSVYFEHCHFAWYGGMTTAESGYLLEVVSAPVYLSNTYLDTEHSAIKLSYNDTGVLPHLACANANIDGSSGYDMIVLPDSSTNATKFISGNLWCSAGGYLLATNGNRALVPSWGYTKGGHSYISDTLRIGGTTDSAYQVAGSNVMIGLRVPAPSMYPLQILPNSGSGSIVWTYDASNNPKFTMGRSDTSIAFALDTAADSYFRGGADIGFGITGPTAYVHVTNYFSRPRAFQVDVNNVQSALCVSNTGWVVVSNTLLAGTVGIGTNTPATALHVNGGVLIEGAQTNVGQINLLSGFSVPGYGATSAYVWTCTNTTTGEGHWAEAPGGDIDGSNVTSGIISVDRLPTNYHTLIVTNLTLSTLNVGELTVTNLAFSTNAAANGATLDMTADNQLTNAAGDITFTGLTGHTATNIRYTVLLLDPSGSDRTLTVPVSWRTADNIHTWPIYATNIGVLSVMTYGLLYTNAAFHQMGADAISGTSYWPTGTLQGASENLTNWSGIDTNVVVWTAANPGYLASNQTWSGTNHFTASPTFSTNAALNGETVNLDLPYAYTNAADAVTFTGLTGVEAGKAKGTVLIVTGSDITLTVPDSWMTADGERSWIVGSTNRGMLTIQCYGNQFTNAAFKNFW